MSGMQRRLRFAWLYLRSQTPWDSEIVAWIAAAEVRRTPPGRALDVGCLHGLTPDQRTVYIVHHASAREFIPDSDCRE